MDSDKRNKMQTQKSASCQKLYPFLQVFILPVFWYVEKNDC